MYQHFKKGKITATLGPASQTPECIERLIRRGVNVFRLNFSHSIHSEHKKRIQVVREVSRKMNVPVSVLLDTKGPEIRVGSFKNGFAIIEEGQKVTLHCDKAIEGDSNKFSVSHKTLDEDVMIGSRILIDDGQLELKVTGKSKGKIEVVALNKYKVLNNKGVNCPGTPTSLKFISEQDKADIMFGCKENVNYIAPSFVRTKQDVLELKKLMKDCGGSSDIKILPKIECQEGVDNFDEILEVSDGIMVARGDLGVEIPYESVPRYQIIMIKKCNAVGKPVIVATQMLQSMMDAPFPTRAEVSDVYWAMTLGADSTMLSGETAAGGWPEESVRVMYRIARRAEKDLNFDKINEKQLASLKKLNNPYVDLVEKIARKMREDSYHSVVLAIDNVDKKLVTALSMIRTRFGIVPLMTDLRKAENLAIKWGVHPIVVKNINEYYDQEKVLQLLKLRNYNGGSKILFVIPDKNDNFTIKTIVS